MAGYLYHCTIFKDTTNAYGVNVSQNTTDKTDFENNRKASAAKVSNVALEETTFITEDSYTVFSARIVSPITWADVKYTEDGRYDLYLLQ